jgi:cephalosporin hydroxylase
LYPGAEQTVTDIDDRAEFERNKREKSIALGRDQELIDVGIHAMRASDKYDYAYLWSWMGVPIIQMPADVIATQEIIWETKPDLIIETGVARGGSVIFMASMLELIGKGRVIGVDVDIRAHNRDSIERHPMAKRVTLIEGSSVDPMVVKRVRDAIPKNGTVMAVLDSDHSHDHVLSELRIYGPLVTRNSYLIVSDTSLGYLSADQTPHNRARVHLKGNEPLSALNAYLKETERFVVDPVVNGKLFLTSSLGGYLRCRGD